MNDRIDPLTPSSSAVLQSHVDPTSARFEANMRFLADMVSQVRNEEEKIREGGGPKAPTGNPFFPVHAELRVTYHFGSDPFHRPGFRPYVHLSGGLAQIDGDVPVPAFADQAAYKRNSRLNLTAWKKSGTAFLGLGGGLMYAITPKSGPFLDVRVLEMLGVSGTAISPLVGYAIGF